MAIGANIFAEMGVEGDGGNAAVPSVGADAMYGPPRGASGTHPLHPANGFGLGFWFGVGGVVALLLIRRSLPG